jgi:hypothetical protein
MCDFGANLVDSEPDRSVSLFRDHLKLLDGGLQRIHIAPGGSFFDPHEVPPQLQTGVLRALERFQFLQGVGIETRPNLVTRERLEHAIQELPPSVRELTIGFGLESRNDFVRELAVNKGYGPEEVRQAAAAIDEVNAAQSRVKVDFEVYALLKPLFLTENEAIEDAISTIEWSLSAGAGTVVLFLNTVKARTLQGYLASSDDVPSFARYEPPYLRSGLEVLLRLPPAARMKVCVLGLQSGIGADRFPRSCGHCEPYLTGTLMAHNLVRDPAVLFEASQSWCSCRPDWEQELKSVADPLSQRVDRVLDILEPRFVPR